MIPSDVMNDLLNTLFPDLTIGENRNAPTSVISG